VSEDEKESADDAEAAEAESVGADPGGGDEGPSPTEKDADSEAGKSAESEARTSKAGGEPKATGEDRMDLPKWNRARVKRKAAKGQETDAFQRGVRKAGRFTVTRAPVVIGGIVLTAAIISGVIWLRDQRREEAAMATRVLAQAVGFQARAQIVDVAQYTKDRKHPFPIPLVNDEAERDATVSKSLSELAGEFPETSADVLSALVRASRLVRAGNFSEAETAYRAFLSEHPGHELEFLAREGLTFALEGKGDLDGALSEVERLVGKTGDFYRDQGLYQKGRLLERSGRGEEARDVYATYADEFPLEESSFARDQVIARLTELAPELLPEPQSGAPGAGLFEGIEP
jgi:predicted negative regulator of RcsB-dependent stress response